MTHTKGPWHKDGGMILAIHEKPTKGFDKQLIACVVAGVSSGYKTPPLSEKSANTHLIAAAPELLDALEEMLLAFADEEACGAVIKARAAIARAAGK